MKKLIAIIVAILLCFILASCGSSKDSTSAFISDRFKIISSNELIDTQTNRYKEMFLYDTQTKVIYVFVKENYSGGLSPLYNADGTLMIYEG